MVTALQAQIWAVRALVELRESLNEERRGRRFDKTELQLRFPSVTDSALVGFKVVQPEASGPSSQ
jgi:hypothetical protein